MTPERWQEVETVLQQALDLPPHEREDFLDTACVNDEELKREATTLIRAYDEAGEFIEEPAVVQDAAVLLNDLPDNNIGRIIGSYRLMERLGTGGMGEVFLAEDNRLSRLVALKILPTYFVSDEARLRRFQSEARTVSALNHPNILTIYEVGHETEEASTHFIATEFIDGKTVRELIDEQSLTLEEILDICVQVAAALMAAHEAGIIHRDIKPENIMRRQDGLVKLLDFGIAKSSEVRREGTEFQPSHTEVGTVLGTAGYMSPEQARGLRVDARTDVWGFGVVLYEMLSGHGPFKRHTRMDTLVSILEHQPDALFVSGPAHLKQLQRVIDRSLQKDVEQRYQTIGEMLADLKDVRKSIESNAASRSDGVPIAQLLERLSQEGAAGSRNLVATWRMFAVIGLVIAVVAGVAATLYIKSDKPQPAVPLNAKLYKEMTPDEQLKFIEQEEQRVSAMMGDQPVRLEGDALRVIKSYVDRYVKRTESSTTNPGSENLASVYQRAVPYIPLIARSFEARKVPITIGIYLPMIESEYRPCFENEIGAKGLFQFLPTTARNYGVAQNEMCDAEKMAPAAAHYIADRMAELGEDAESITLVLVSYNRGEQWVRDSLRQLRDTPDYQRNFWTMLKHRDKLDQSFNETAGYVPMFFAAAIVGENPKNFELTTPPLSSLARPEKTN